MKQIITIAEKKRGHFTLGHDHSIEYATKHRISMRKITVEGPSLLSLRDENGYPEHSLIGNNEVVVNRVTI